MLGAAPTLERETDPTQSLLRGLVVLSLAIAVHVLPLLFVTLSAIPQADPETTFTVALDDSLIEAPLLTSEKIPVPKPQPEPEQVKPPEPPPQAQQPQPPQQKPPEQPKAAAQQPQPEKPKATEQAPAKAEEKKPYNAPDLEALDAPKVAFDESKSTKEIPKDGYLSDRNSTAADRGPKNLKRGDPFMDKGQSNVIRYQEKRGEGGLPAIPSDAASGSVDKEGSPDAGKGVIDTKPPDTAKPLRLPLTPAPQPQAGAFEAPTQAPATTPKPQPLATVPLPPQVPLEIKKDEKPKLLGDGPGVEDEAPRVALKPIEQTPVPAARVEPEPPKKTAPPPIIDSPALPQADARQPVKPPDELDAFKALLDGKGDVVARGGNEGNKAGIHAREGKKGHEGDGNMRPGHDEAVSDVTTVNLESSAAEFDDSRFAKKFDAKTAYIKPLARRIDGKWKAEIAARGRTRMEHGVVTIRFKLRNDGLLLEAREAKRTPGKLPDELVNIAKIAVERAAAPKSEPFPSELMSKETLEFEFSFLY